MSETSPFGVIDNANADEAYEKVLPEAMALRPESLLVINLDLTTSAFTAMGVIEKLPPFYEQMRGLPNFSLEQAVKLRDYALALYTAQLRYTFATTPPEQIPELLEEATRWRDILIADAKALVARGLLKAELLKELTGTHGYKNVAVDLSGLTTIFKGQWASFEGKVALKKEELAEADKVAMRLAAAVIHRENSPEEVAAVTDIRQRVFSLFYATYDQVRRAISYLRWSEDDADEIVPSLYAGRPNTNIVKKNNNEANGQKPQGTTQEPPAAGSIATANAGAPGNNKVAVGFPGGEPLGTA